VWVTRGMRGAMRAVARVVLARVVLLLAVVPQSARPQPVEISSVNPSVGSLAGGTRMHIRGTGFSNNMGGI